MPKTESGKLCGPIRFEISTILCEICDGHKNSYVKSWEDTETGSENGGYPPTWP